MQTGKLIFFKVSREGPVAVSADSHRDSHILKLLAEQPWLIAERPALI